MERKVIVVTACLIEKDGKFLLVQEKQPRAYKLWNFPAGKLEADITLIENAKKEAKEETGFDVKIGNIVGIYEDFEKDSRNVIIFVFNASIIKGKLKVPEDELIQAKWLTFEDIKKIKNKLRGNYIMKAIEQYKQGRTKDIKTILSIF